MKRFLTSGFFCLSLFVVIMSDQAVGQSWPVRDDVLQVLKNKNRNDIPERHLRTISSNRRDGNAPHLIECEGNWYQDLKAGMPELLTVSLEIPGYGLAKLLLIQMDFSPFRFTRNHDEVVTDVRIPLCFRGVIEGEKEKNTVILTVSSTGMNLTIYQTGQEWKMIKDTTRQTRMDFANVYILIPGEDLSNGNNEALCGTQDPEGVFDQDGIMPMRDPQDYCVYVFIECFDSLYQWCNSDYQQTIDFVFDLFGHVATGYWNESINLKMSEINVWTTMDPFAQTSREAALADLSAFYQDNYWGNIGVGLDHSLNPPGRSGLAGAIGLVKGEYPNNCPAYDSTSNTFCYNDLDYYVNVIDFPNGPVSTQPMVYLVMHEIGHLLGSAHTHWCGWNLGGGVYGALDNCATTEGGCPPGPDPGSTGGTIMSYCVSGGDTTSFLNGFGPIPGAAIRSFVDGNSCLEQCPTCPTSVTINYSTVNNPGHVYRYEVSESISATGVLTSTAYTVMDAGLSIVLTPGFHAEEGSVVHIFIDGCGGIR